MRRSIEDWPFTIACNDEKFILISNFMLADIWKRSHNLLFRRQLGCLFEFKITNRSRQSKIAIDAAKVDEAAGCSNTGPFGL
jgi:hypothetical protein